MQEQKQKVYGVTKVGFSGLLKAGVRGEVIWRLGADIAIKLQNVNVYHDDTVYHGKAGDFVFDGDKKMTKKRGKL